MHTYTYIYIYIYIFTHIQIYLYIHLCACVCDFDLNLQVSLPTGIVFHRWLIMKVVPGWFKKKVAIVNCDSRSHTKIYEIYTYFIYVYSYYTYALHMRTHAHSHTYIQNIHAHTDPNISNRIFFPYALHVHTYTHTHTYRACTHTNIQIFRNYPLPPHTVSTWWHAHIHTYINTFIHTYIHTYYTSHTQMHTYIHTYIHTYMHPASSHTQWRVLTPWYRGRVILSYNRPPYTHTALDARTYSAILIPFPPTHSERVLTRWCRAPEVILSYVYPPPHSVEVILPYEHPLLPHTVSMWWRDGIELQKSFCRAGGMPSQ